MNSTQRKIVDEREARKCLAAAVTAGQTAGQWAQAHGIDGRSLNMWRLNLSRRSSAHHRGRASVVRGRPLRVELVELVPAPAVPAPAVASPVPAKPGRYTVVVGDLRLEVGDDVDTGALRRMIGVLRTC